MRATAALVVGVLTMPVAGEAADFECTVTRKVDNERLYSADDLSRGTYSVLIQETAAGAVVARCSFSSSANRVTCDTYPVDRIEIDPTSGVKKFYVFRSQFDVQVFKDLSFVENNGRGGIAYGACRASASGKGEGAR